MFHIIFVYISDKNNIPEYAGCACCLYKFIFAVKYLDFILDAASVKSVLQSHITYVQYTLITIHL